MIIPAYNRSELIRRAIASVRAQTPNPPAEIIVVDDCSSDDTAAVAESLGVTVIRHEVNQGAATARNTAVAAATQEWIAPLDSDDEWLPHHLATLWALRDDHVLVAACAMQLGEHRSEGLLHGLDRDRPVVYRTPARILAPYNPIPASAVMVRRAAILEAGGYDTTLRYAEDWDLWLRVLEQGTAVQSPQVITLYYRHVGQKTTSREGPAKAQLRIAESCRSRPWWSRRLHETRMAAVAWDGLRRAARGRDAGEALRQARVLLTSPTRARAAASLAMHRRRLRRRSASIDVGRSVDDVR